MGRISFTQIASLPDVADVIAYEINFGNIPGVGDGRGLTFRSKDTNIPGVSNEAYTVTLHGHTRNFGGREIFSGTWSTTFVETVDGYVLTSMRAWHERVRGSTSGNSTGYLADYSVNAQLIVYDSPGNVIKRMIIEECFPQDIPDTQLSGESSAGMSIPVTFKYARCMYDQSL